MIIIQVIFAVTIFLLVVAVIGLFAMMGELVRRVDAIGGTGGVEDTSLSPFVGARIGAAPDHWPDELAEVGSAPQGLLVVLSTLCTSCSRIASGATGSLPFDPAIPTGIVVSCSSRESGMDFVVRYGLDREGPLLTDDMGKWLIHNFAVDGSPVVLVFRQGKLISARTFVSARALETVMVELKSMKEEANAASSGG